MKARKVKGLDPDGTLAENAERIVAVRLDGAARRSSPAALDPVEVEALHDMRIAAKRLRYVLELTRARAGRVRRRRARARRSALQDLLGDIHDCDEMLPRVRARGGRRRSDAGGTAGGAAREVPAPVAPAARTASSSAGC